MDNEQPFSLDEPKRDELFICINPNCSTTPQVFHSNLKKIHLEQSHLIRPLGDILNKIKILDTYQLDDINLRNHFYKIFNQVASRITQYINREKEKLEGFVQSTLKSERYVIKELQNYEKTKDQKELLKRLQQLPSIRTQENQFGFLNNIDEFNSQLLPELKKQLFKSINIFQLGLIKIVQETQSQIKQISYGIQDQPIYRPRKLKQGTGDDCSDIMINDIQNDPKPQDDCFNFKLYQSKAVENVLQKLGKYNYDVDDSYSNIIPMEAMVIPDTKAIYKGQWIDDKRWGRGKQTWPDGTVYEGYWAHDKANGNGRIIYANGEYYEGNWVNDQKQGYGILYYLDGSRYEGQWFKNKQKHGQGIEIQSNGGMYKGKFKNGQKEGQGTLKTAEGHQYTGEFQQNKMQGQGSFIWKDGRTYQGQWLNNKMHGKGEYFSPVGNYVGEFVEDCREGYGIFEWTGGKIYKGFWKRDKEHGVGVLINRDNTKVEDVWIMGKRINE